MGGTRAGFTWCRPVVAGVFPGVAGVLRTATQGEGRPKGRPDNHNALSQFVLAEALCAYPITKPFCRREPFVVGTTYEPRRGQRSAQMRLMGILVLCAAVSACTDSVKLKNPTTGETAQCGPYQLEGMG